MKKNPLRDSDLKLLNEQLRELREIRQDLTAADTAMVPGVKDMIEGCDQCIQRAELLKKTYFPNKK